MRESARAGAAGGGEDFGADAAGSAGGGGAGEDSLKLPDTSSVLFAVSLLGLTTVVFAFGCVTARPGTRAGPVGSTDASLETASFGLGAQFLDAQATASPSVGGRDPAPGEAVAAALSAGVDRPSTPDTGARGVCRAIDMLTAPTIKTDASAPNWAVGILHQRVEGCDLRGGVTGEADAFPSKRCIAAVIASSRRLGRGGGGSGNSRAKSSSEFISALPTDTHAIAGS